MKTSNKIKGGLTTVATYVAREFRTIATSYSILLVMIGGIFIYGLLYNYMYAPNLIRDAPVAVVDRSGTPLSREYARLLNASPQVEIYSYAPDMPSAKIMMETNRVVGIIFIPEDFESRVGRGEQAVFLAYGNTSAFLNFASVEEAAAGAMEELDSRHRPDMVVFVPPAALYAMSQTQSIDIVGTPLYNPTEGYGSYLIPAVLIVILFQTLMMVIGMISGKERYTGSILYYSRHGLGFGRMAGVVLSKTFTYCILYAVFAYFLIGLLPEIYSIPDIGNRRDIVMLLIPFLLATCFFGIAFLCRLRESDPDDYLLLGRPDLSVRHVVPAGTDAVVLAGRPFRDSGLPRRSGVHQTELHGSGYGRYRTRIRDAVDSVHRVFHFGLPGVPVQHPQSDTQPAGRRARCFSERRPYAGSGKRHRGTGVRRKYGRIKFGRFTVSSTSKNGWPTTYGQAHRTISNKYMPAGCFRRLRPGLRAATRRT